MGNELTLPSTACPHALGVLPPAEDYLAVATKAARRRHSLPAASFASRLQACEDDQGSRSAQRARGRAKPMNYRLKWPTCVLIESNANTEEAANSPKRRGRKRKHPESAPMEAALSPPEAAELCLSSTSSLNSSLASTGQQSKRRRKAPPAAGSSSSSFGSFLENCAPLLDTLPRPPPKPPANARLPNLHAVMRRFDTAAGCPFAYAWDEEARAEERSVVERREAYRANTAALNALSTPTGGGRGRRRSAGSRKSGLQAACADVEAPKILARKREGGALGLLVSWD